MPKTNVLVAITACLVVFTTSNAVAKPDEASPAQVQNCRLIQGVSASSGYGKNSSWLAIAKSRAETKAGGLGATHIVWTSAREIGAFNGTVSANAYHCQR